MSADSVWESGWHRISSQGIRVLEAYLETGELPVAKEAASGAGTAPTAQTQQQGGRSALFSKRDYALLYSTVYDLCLQRSPENYSKTLYEHYGLTIAAYCDEKVRPALKGKTGEPLLIELKSRWEKHIIYVRWLNRFFHYLDRYYVTLHSLNTLAEEGDHIFYERVYTLIEGKAAQAVLDEIAKDRNGVEIDPEVIKGVVSMYPAMECGITGAYEKHLESIFLKTTHEYYQRLSRVWLTELTFPEYLQKVSVALDAEESRCDTYLQRSTSQKVRKIVVQVLLQDCLVELLEKPTAFEHLLANDKREDLRRAFLVFSLFDGVGHISAVFKPFVIARGVELRSKHESTAAGGGRAAASDPTTFIKSLILLYENYHGLVKSAFSGDFIMQKSLKEAFEVFLNRETTRNSVSSQLATFCDRILKKGGGEKLTEDAIEDYLAKTVELFGFLSDKDLFAEEYRSLLAKRLLYESSASSDSEKFMISRLKQKCGAQFTSKLEGMMNDLTVAADMQRLFAEHVKASTNPKALTSGIDFSGQVLTTGAWPTYRNFEMTLPPQMDKCLSSFRDFYSKRSDAYGSRRLTWVHELGSAMVNGTFKARRYDFLCNTLQACMLLLFNDSNQPSLHFSVIRNSLALEEDVVRKLLGSFFLGKIQLLKKVKKPGTQPKGVSLNDEFEVNYAFSSATRRVKIPTPVLEEVHNREKVQQDRSHAIEAAIVRILKARKELKHQQLITEVLAHLHFFAPQPKQIKQKIETLIEREFLERDATNPEIFRYLA